ncbi:hypothetical protein BLNAU_5393 [Blattamonas nauphoetae]|uniref:Uncharacterized protein n=1 Tax=Blattamonas nauphoetae TaxID=2049346 RepID=A0ABQ9Y7D8_9EUKA|nr:hypothetical protein BLNAU_5393 [Blattamonas nauphoetae]
METFCLIILTTASHEATYLPDLMDYHLDRGKLSSEPNDDILHLSPGVYELFDYPVMSTTLKMEGKTSAITNPDLGQTPVFDEIEDDRSEHPKHFAKANMDTFHSLFLFDNSTISMNQLIFDCGCEGMAFAKVTSSEVVVSSSKIVSNSKQTPFVIGTGSEEVGSSISVIDCSHISSSSMVLLPLVSTSTCRPTPPHDSSSTNTPPPDPISPFLSVSGVGLVVSNVDLILGTGPLLDFGTLTQHSTRSTGITIGEISTVLVGSVLRNVTSHDCDVDRLVLPNGLSQKLVGTSVTGSTSHLYGTGCLDLNLFGSVGCVNTSFSHCSMNTEKPDDRDSFFFPNLKNKSRYSSFTTQITLSLHLCTFSSMTSRFDGSCLNVNAAHDVTLSECSFNSIDGGFGGTLQIVSRPTGKGRLALSLCSFVSCSSKELAAGLILKGSSLLSIHRCFFKNLTMTIPDTYSGALWVVSTTTASISECVFMECSSDEDHGSAGAVFVLWTSLEMASVQFVGNTARKGSDVHIASGCGSLAELKEHVSDCYTDKPNTSLHFFESGFQTRIIKPFGSVTTITNLHSKLFPTHSDAIPQGTIEVETADDVQGTMLLLLDSTNPDDPNSESSSPPTTCRVVAVDFPTPSKTGTSDVLSFGDNERQKFPSTSSLIAASIPSTLIDIPFPSPSVSLPPPHVRKILCKPGTGYEVLVSLEGWRLAMGEYTIFFEGSSSLSLAVRFFAGGTGLTPQISSSVSVGPGGADRRFALGKTYKVDRIIFNYRPVLMKPKWLHLVIPPFTTTCVIEVNKLKGEDDGTCRELDRRCGSIDAETYVDALIRSSSLDLKLVRVSSGRFEFSNGVITCEPSFTTNPTIRTSNSDLCSWTTGAIEIVDSTAVLTRCNLTNLPQGAIIQRGGNVTLEEVNFLSNGPTNNDFPSARQNVMCSEDGKLLIKGLTGDGRSPPFPGSGISADSCDVFTKVTKMSIPLLDTSRSTITRDRKTGDFEVELIGSGFLPCGLKVELFSRLVENGTEVSDTLVVDTNTASNFTETRIVFKVTPKQVANLSKKHEWGVRVWSGVSFIETPLSLPLQEKRSDLLWLIRAIILVVVVLVGAIPTLLLFWKSRSKKPVEKNESKMDTPNEAKPTVITKAASDQPEHESAVEQAIQRQTGQTSRVDRNSEEGSWSHNRSGH